MMSQHGSLNSTLGYFERLALTQRYPQTDSAGILKKGIIAVLLVMVLDAVRMLLGTIFLRDCTTSLGLSPLVFTLSFFFPLVGALGARGNLCCLRCFILVGLVTPFFFVLQGFHMFFEIPDVRASMQLNRRCDPRSCYPDPRITDASVRSQIMVECLAASGIGGVELGSDEEVHNIGPEIYGQMMKKVEPGNPMAYHDARYAKLEHMHWECHQVGEHWMKCSEFEAGSTPIVDTIPESKEDLRLHQWWSETWHNFFGVWDDPLAQHTELIQPKDEEFASGIVLVKSSHGMYRTGVDDTPFQRIYRCVVNIRDMNGFWKKASMIGELGYVALMLLVAAFSIGQATIWWVVTKLAHNLYTELRTTPYFEDSPSKGVERSLTFGEARSPHLDIQLPLHRFH